MGEHIKVVERSRGFCGTLSLRDLPATVTVLLPSLLIGTLSLNRSTQLDWHVGAQKACRSSLHCRAKSIKSGCANEPYAGRQTPSLQTCLSPIQQWFCGLRTGIWKCPPYHYFPHRCWAARMLIAFWKLLQGTKSHGSKENTIQYGLFIN